MAIQGLDTSSPDDMVKDGACCGLHNLRWKDNAWRPVHPHKEKRFAQIFGDDYKVIYKHPATDDDKYIVQLSSKGKYRYYEVSINDPSMSKAKLIASFDEEQRVSHFGNVLMFSGSGNKSSAYIYRNGTYSIYTSATTYPSLSYSLSQAENMVLRPLAFAVSEPFRASFDTPTAQGHYYDILPNRWYEARSSIHPDFNVVDEVIKNAPPTCQFKFLWEFARWDTDEDTMDAASYSNIPSYHDSGWYGEHAMFAVLKMKDGTIINPSPLSIAISNNGYRGCEIRRELVDFYKFANTHFTSAKFNGIVLVSGWSNAGDNVNYSNIPNAPISYVTENIMVSVPTSANTDLIDSIAIYSTRIQPSLDLSKMRDIQYTSILFANSAYSDNKLAAQPFYLLAEKKLQDCDIIQDTYSFSYNLTATEAEKIVTAPVYTPTNPHSLVGAGSFDYNSRMHLFDIEQYLAESPIFEAIKDSGYTFSAQLGIHLLNSDIDATKWGKAIKGLNIKDEYSLILSYHDYRVSEILAYVGVATPYTLSLKTKEAMGNNIAYYTAPPTAEYKYPPIILTESNGVLSDLTPSMDDVILEPNRIQVSAPNNPFSFPFENSYAVGSANNRIIALQSAAIKIGDEKVGSLPLYVFTTEGIFALRAGESTLYAAVNPINYDKIINPNTLAINGAVVYITEKGVHLLSEQGTAVISTPIHTADGMPPLHFLRTCKILWPKQYNEIVLHNETMDKAYVFNLDSGYWSTRTLNGTKLNTDELVYGDSIYDLADEDEKQCLNASIHTRPIKLGNVEFKRLETIIPRMNTGNHNFMLDMAVTGSVDGSLYQNLRLIDNMEMDSDKVNPLVLRRTPYSAKYFEMVMELTPLADKGGFSPSITHIDFEWYTRFMRRMR